MDVISPRISGNIAVTDYSNKEGWIKYKKLSDKYAKEIRSIIQKFKIKTKGNLPSNKLPTDLMWKLLV